MYIKWKYNVNMLKLNMYECNQAIRRCAKPPPNYVPHINLLKERILVKDSSKSIDGFNYNEILLNCVIAACVLLLLPMY